MGITWVAAILRGNIEYIANVGDSRAYLVRGNRIRQVSQDHSWVEEQVRAGLLTKEQARTHAQRNVITRSLGTQQEVEIDLFREIVQEGDPLVLCSDGLSGLVQDDDLKRTIQQFVRQEGVNHLVEHANENGGTDNITAIVARVMEVGSEPPNVRQPVPIGGSEVSNEETARLFTPVSAGWNLTARNGEIPVPGSSFPTYSSGPLAMTELEPDTAPHPSLRSPKRRRRLLYPGVALLILLVLVGIGGGGFYFLRSNQAKTISQTLNGASQLISTAKTQVLSNPALALQDLSSAQGNLQDLQKNYNLDTLSKTTFNNLQTQLVSETRTAITNYNKAANIGLLLCTTSTPNSISNENLAQTLAVIEQNNAT